MLERSVLDQLKHKAVRCIDFAQRFHKRGETFCQLFNVFFVLVSLLHRAKDDRILKDNTEKRTRRHTSTRLRTFHNASRAPFRSCPKTGIVSAMEKATSNATIEV